MIDPKDVSITANDNLAKAKNKPFHTWFKTQILSFPQPVQKVGKTLATLPRWAKLEPESNKLFCDRKVKK